MPMPFRSRFRPPRGLEATRPAAERTLAAARVFVTAAALLAIYFDPTEPTRYASFTYGLLSAYVLYSVALFAMLRQVEVRGTAAPLAIHTVDLLAAASLTLSTEGPNSPFFVFFGFVLLAAATRWGLYEAVITTIVSVVLLGGEAIPVTMSPSARLAIQGDFTLNRFVIRCAYLAVLAGIVGYVADADKASRAELALLASMLSRAQGARSFSGTLRVIARELLQVFESDSAWLVTHELPRGRTFVWKATRTPAGQINVEMTKAHDASCSAFALPGAVRCALVGRDAASGTRFRAADDDCRAMAAIPRALPPTFLPDATFSRAYTVDQTVGGEWRIRVIVFDPRLPQPPLRTLNLLRSIASQLVPVTYNAYLVGRLRSRAVAADRARVARELHDSVVQALIGVRMELEAVKMRPDASGMATDLTRVTDLLGREIVHLRTLMMELSAGYAAPTELQRVVADAVDRFEHASGIATRLVSHGQTRVASPRMCHEIARILNEALVNVQKHSGARSVVVGVDHGESVCVLSIEDDGCGFPFEGRLTDGDLDSSRRGPRVIKERVRALGGSLSIESTPGHGARLEISVPVD